MRQTVRLAVFRRSEGDNAADKLRRPVEDYIAASPLRHGDVRHVAASGTVCGNVAAAGAPNRNLPRRPSADAPNLRRGIVRIATSAGETLPRRWALLVELDKIGPADEATLKTWLPASFRRFGIAGDRVKKVVILPRSRELKEIGEILLTNPDDETAAIATTVKGAKSNQSN